MDSKHTDESEEPGRPTGLLSLRGFLTTAAAVAALAALPATRARTAGEPGGVNPQGHRRPNIILIHADDLGYGELGSYGQELIRTPELDRLAADGTRFTDYYAGSTVCAPSRYSLLTGQHTGHTAIRANGHAADPANPYVSEVLQSAGYRTALIGKYGIGTSDERSVSGPLQKGFDEFFGYYSDRDAHDYWPPYLWDGDEQVFYPENEGMDRGTFGPDLLADRVLSFVRENRNRPFFLYFSPNMPHAPNLVPDDGQYADEPWGAGERSHAAQITRLDAQVGDLRRELRGLAIEQNTVILFTSDNGPHEEGTPLGPIYPENGPGLDPTFFDASGGLRGIKRNLYEGGIRVPMIAYVPEPVMAWLRDAAGVRGPGPRGRASEYVWTHWDLFPTIAELAGAAVPAGLDGQSVVPELVGGHQPPEVYQYWEYHDTAARFWSVVFPRAAAAEPTPTATFRQAVRFGRWKGVRYEVACDALEIYDLQTDPGETTNLVDTRADVAEQISRIMAEARKPSPVFTVPDGQTCVADRPPERNAAFRASGVH